MDSAPASSVGQECSRAVVASPDSNFRSLILGTIHSSGWQSEEAEGGADALAKIESGNCHALVLDCWLPDLDVDELVKNLQASHPEVDVLIVDTKGGGARMVQEVPRHPATQRLFRGLQDIRCAEPEETAKEETPAVTEEETEPSPVVEPLPGMVGTSEAMAHVYRMVRRVAGRTTTVLLSGETGTGKELVARAIHSLSPRSCRPFVVVNCAAIPETLMEAELFGFTRGAFTGAVQSRVGRIHSAHGGTLFLDEIGEMAPSMQAKLLRFLQEGEVQRLGSSDQFRVDVRVVAATNLDLVGRVNEGRFRRDLFYRLSVFPIELPTLREREEDVMRLAQSFLFALCREAEVPLMEISPDASRLLQHYSWPGNVRELQHVLERAFILSDREFVVRPEHFSSVSHR